MEKHLGKTGTELCAEKKKNKMITIKLIHDRKKQAKRGESASVEIRLTANRRSYYISTGVRVLKSEWIAGSVSNRPDAKELNERLEILVTKANQYANDMLQSDGLMNIDVLKRQIWYANESVKSGPVLLEWISEQIERLNVVYGTRKHYYTLLMRLNEFGKLQRWEDVTVANIYDWDAWLHQLPDRYGGKMSDGGVFTYHKCLKALLRRAVEMGQLQENPYDRLRGKFKRGEKENVEYLTQDEVQKIERLQLLGSSDLSKAHDLFVFQLYTGLSYSDAQAFDIRDYKRDGKTWKHVGERIKTGVPFVSQLLPPALTVIEKYDMKVPRIANNIYNRALKAVGLMAGIKTPLHSHLARHTFATMMLRNGAKIENVSRMLGHTNITQTQRYAKVLAESVHEDFDMVAAKMKNV